MTVSDDEILVGLEDTGQPVRFATGDDASVPAPWRPIIEADEAARRAEIARSLWNGDMFELLPDFARMLREELADVRVVLVGNEPMLAYAVEHRYADDRTVSLWIGTTPGTDAATESDGGGAELVSAIPAPVRTFQSEVHRRFTAPDLESYGFRPVVEMTTLVDEWGLGSADLPDWEHAPQPRRLLVLLTTYSELRVCVSPDLPDGMAVAVYRSDPPDPVRPVGESLDEELVNRLVEGG
ncbi:hypothetical protein GOARA_021_00920 [Gordonia araii NBRC 100433]|uniref:Uncharacterized protein n=1 Tax=Gordonia araii NBRC 100433 TaxID=1073574 RepID=G7GZ30_9ACTN|nr:hypothetical protein [Gordonia araii]NNG97063.1 hypothetical protein [Gordonia araii NBRC 100433]GAB08855.1 hypothetical protein GOARA_021_00920 [Gordonia araii NBRC 100433]